MKPSRYFDIFRMFKLEEDFNALSDALRKTKVELDTYHQ